MVSPVSFFHIALSDWSAVVRFQHLAQTRFRVKLLPAQKDKGKHSVVPVFLQGAPTHTEQFGHLLVRQVTLPVQRRAVTLQKCGKPFRVFLHVLQQHGHDFRVHRDYIVLLVHSASDFKVNTRLTVCGVNSADQRNDPFHVLRLVIKTVADLRVSDKATVAQLRQRAGTDSQLSADLFPGQPFCKPPFIALALQGGDFLHESTHLCHHPVESLFLDRYYFHIHVI